jgi:catechol 2,3-dioxygenase-like lactoylglutathione lyase family enzyme
MKVTEIAYTCYPVTDLARARTFYEGTLGLTCTMDHPTPQGHWVEYDIGTSTLAIGSAPGWEPSNHGCSASLEVEDFQQAVASLRQAAVRFKVEPFETPVCHMAFVEDPDGNVLGIHKRKPGHH